MRYEQTFILVFNANEYEYFVHDDGNQIINRSHPTTGYLDKSDDI